MKLESRSALNDTFGSKNPIGRFQSQDTTLTELSNAGCVLFATGEDSAELAHRAGIAAKVELPISPGSFSVGPERAALWLSPRSWLIRCRVDDEADLVASLNEAFPDKLANAVPFTDALCWFDLSGPSALDYLTEGSFISLEPAGLSIGHAKRTVIAQIAAVVVRQSQSTWHIGVERSRAPYFVDWLAAAANSRPRRVTLD